MLELGRSDIGFGRLIVDEAGVTRKRMFRTQRIAWDDILGYRLGAKLMNATGEAGLVFGGDIAHFIDFWHALRGRRTPIRFSCELIGAQQRVMVNWRFANVELAIEEIMKRVGPRLLASSRAELARDNIAHFGALTIAKHGVQWKSREPLAFAAVEKLEIVNRSPVEIYVRQRDRAWPYAHFAMDDIPNALAMLELADELGYRVGGKGVIAT
jgi:Bacterial PH domain